MRAEHKHDFVNYDICRICGQTEAAAANDCHHCNDALSVKHGRCWWCLRPVSRPPSIDTLEPVTRATALLEKITPGEWRVDPQVAGWHYPPDPRRRVQAWRSGSHGDQVSTAVAEYLFPDNAAFIAAAPQLVRDLLAVIERMNIEASDTDANEFRIAELERRLAEYSSRPPST